ncbi:MAG: aminopeptidase [Burkholderiales bacterium]|nr:aminopeptidase [Burkholderiales bacterium]
MRWSRALMWAGAGSLLLALAVAGTLCLSSGCTSIGYLAQSASGHLGLLASARPVDQVLADPAAPAALKERLALTQRMRDYAVTELGLPDNRSYRAYADIHRAAAVWNVVAAPELSLQLRTWCFPVVGCVSYRGYFDQAVAEAFAATLQPEGWETSVYAVPAYSTLGFSDWLGGDPLLSSFIQWPEGELARLIFHELSHQVAYAEGDTVFNESYATAVERLGGARWLAERASPEAREQYQRFDQRRRELRALTQDTRERLEALYRGPGSEDDKRAGKAAEMARLRAEHERLKRERWDGYSGFDAYIARSNNASLGVQAAYHAWVPAFEVLFEREGRSFTRFHAAVQRLAAQPKTERDATLRALQP